MGECGPTATLKTSSPKPSSYSRWGNAGQLQLEWAQKRGWRVIADGGMRANCNSTNRRFALRRVIADGGMRANCNDGTGYAPYVEL